MKVTRQSVIKDQIEILEVKQSLNKKELIISIWGSTDYFIQRSFDVLFVKVKKELDGREFKTLKGFIIRTK